MHAIDMRLLVAGLAVSILVVVLRGAVGAYAVWRSRFLVPFDRRDAKTRSDFASVYLVLGIAGAVGFGLVIAIKLILR